MIVGFCFLHLTNFIHKGDHRVQGAARLPSILDLNTGWWEWELHTHVCAILMALRGFPSANVQMSNQTADSETKQGSVLLLGELLNAKPDLLGGRLSGKIYPFVLYKL